VAASKAQPVEKIMWAYSQGLRHFGENYVSEGGLTVEWRNAVHSEGGRKSGVDGEWCRWKSGVEGRVVCCRWKSGVDGIKSVVEGRVV